MTRFSTVWSSPTRTTSALPGSSSTNSMCFRRVDLLLGEHDAGAMRQARRSSRRPRAARRRSTCARLPAMCASIWRRSLRGEVADLEQPVDEQAQAELRRQPPRRGVRRGDEAELLQVRHHVADRGRRQRHRQHARQIARPDGLARLEVASRRSAGEWCGSGR